MLFHILTTVRRHMTENDSFTALELFLLNKFWGEVPEMFENGDGSVSFWSLAAY